MSSKSFQIIRKFLYCIAAIAFLLDSAGSSAADDAVQKSAQLLEKHYYESASAALRIEAAKGELPPVAALTLARIYVNNAQLYRALHRSSLDTGVTYLKKLSAQKTDRSKYVALYLGEYLNEAGQGKAAAAQLSRFARQKNVQSAYLEFAKVDAAVARKAKIIAPGGGDALVRSYYATALGQGAGQRSEAEKQMDQAIADLAKNGQPVPVRAVTGALGVYARGGHPDKGFALLAKADLSQPSLEENVSKNKTVRFYDPALLGNLADLNQVAAEGVLQRVRMVEKYKSVAGYFLAESYVNNGQFKEASSLLAELIGASDLPAAYRDRAVLMQAEADIETGKASKGNATLAEMGRKFAQEPVMLSEVLMTCVRSGAKCPEVVEASRALSSANVGERYRNLHFAVGEQYAAEKKYTKAMAAMETARDKSNKNRIDTNDPVLLARLADMYIETKNFSEALEIYFEMNKEFPAVRQLQETGQGVYSTEYRSAGDAKIF